MIFVHKHAKKHGLTAEEVAYAWEHAQWMRERHGSTDPAYWIAIGITTNGKLCELVGFQDENNNWYVIHAMVPPTEKFLVELGIVPAPKSEKTRKKKSRNKRSKGKGERK